MAEELSLLLGGAQGAGLESSANILTKIFGYLGYGTFSDREYFSNIKGRHSYIHSRVSSNKLPLSLTYPVQILCAMDAETVFTHFEDVEEGGFLVYDASLSNVKGELIPSIEPKLRERLKQTFKKLGIDSAIGSLTAYLHESKGVNVIALNYSEILSELGKRFKLLPQQASRYLSSIIVGAVVGLVQLDPEAINLAIQSRFRAKPELVEHNKFAVDLVSSQIRERYGLTYKLDPSRLGREEFLVVSGNDIVAMGKLVGGLRYQSYYPITPAADESFTIESYQKLIVDQKNLGSAVVIQTEDEIAAITSAIGAAMCGVRSATATSGPGFSLMVEGLGYAGQNEVPVVITYYQRGAPSTGQPTRGGQQDLLFSLFASHGEFPRIVLSSGDHEEAFYDSIEAFNLAERYQVPVIHLLDKFLANCISTMAVPDLSKVKLDRGKISSKVGVYKRFSLSEAISPWVPLGSDVVQWYAGDEHSEEGHIDEDPINRVEMYDKRMKKLEIMDKEIPPESRAVFLGSHDAEYLLVGWGFVKGVALDAIEELSKKGLRGAYLNIKMFTPFPSDYVNNVISEFEKDKVIPVEHNYLAQASMAITLNTGIKLEKAIVKYTGRPIYKHELVHAIEKVLEGSRREVLTYGQ
ncbi:MAG: 2-oxoacid:ferredoxin oxidoreductase subunit alpha [Nitrososphaeria archaeon]